MLAVLVFAVLWASCSTREYYLRTQRVQESASFSSVIPHPERVGPITAVRIWENSNSYINGIQLRYGPSFWEEVMGRELGLKVEMFLFEGEGIIQVSGKYQPSNYLYMLEFVTTKGRFLRAGQPRYNSFHFYTLYKDEELQSLSGYFNGLGITSLKVHWERRSS